MGPGANILFSEMDLSWLSQMTMLVYQFLERIPYLLSIRSAFRIFVQHILQDWHDCCEFRIYLRPVAADRVPCRLEIVRGLAAAGIVRQIIHPPYERIGSDSRPGEHR